MMRDHDRTRGILRYKAFRVGYRLDEDPSLSRSKVKKNGLKGNLG